MPDPDSTRFGRKKPISHRSKSSGPGGGAGGYVGGSGTLYQAQQDQAYLNMLKEAMSGGRGGGGGGGRSYVGGGGGGGGGYGPSAYDKWRIAEEERRRKELEKQKNILRLQLTAQRNAAAPAIANYSREAQRQVTNAYQQNQSQTNAYNNQLRQLGSQMLGGARSELAGLQGDLRAQGGLGGDMRALQAAAQQNMTGTQFLQNNAQAFNARLAQVMSGARADAYSTVGNIRAAGLSDLENSYLQALADVGMLGLGNLG